MSVLLGDVNLRNPAITATITGPLGQVNMANSIPVVVASNQSNLGVNLNDGSGNTLGSTSAALDVNIKSGSIANTGFNVSNFPHGTAGLWTANVTSTNDVSAAINLSAVPYTQISIYGTSSVAATLTVQMSNDGVTYYKSQYNSVLAVGADFGFTVQSSAYYVRLVATGIATTATITAIANYS